MILSKAEMIIWVSKSDSDRERIRAVLSEIVAGPHFRTSKRYPAFLRYVVERTLDGQAAALKERTIGVDVFDRSPGYDTNADPVVRYSASEVRKRLAQHYHEAQEEAEIQIELPLGSYVPEFRIRAETPDMEQSSVTAPSPGRPGWSVMPGGVFVQAVDEPQAVNPKRPRNFRLLSVKSLVAALLLVGGSIATAYKVTHPSAMQSFWHPALAVPGPVLLVVGTGNLELKGPESPQTTFYDHMVGPYEHVSFASAVAIARLTNVLQANRTAYGVKESERTSLQDLKERPVILVGALNNLWSLRLIAPLRYQFIPGPLARIVDEQNRTNQAWTVDFNLPYTRVATDYAIIARYNDPLTNGVVMIVGGLGPYGTEAASELISSPRQFDKVAQSLPAGWKDRNIEFVIKTDVIAGQAGPSSLVASAIW